MHEVAIVGAGELGGLIAHALARRNASAVVRLIDGHARVAEGKTLDIGQAAAVEGFATAVAGATGLSAASGADVIVIADSAAPAAIAGTATEDWHGDAGVSLIRQANAIAPRALFLCAGTRHRQLVERSVRELHIPRTRMLGSACEAFVSAATAIVALELDVSPRDVTISILGVPPERIVIAWEDASVAGHALTGMVSEPIRRQLTRRIGALWPVGPHALAAGVCKVVDAVSGYSRRPVTCFIAPDDQAGLRMRAAALPVRFAAGGIAEVVMPRLSAVEQTALENAMML
jgi:malate dehydrogenase